MHPGRRVRTTPGPGARWRAIQADRGSVSLELAIAFPVVLLLVTALMQYGLWFFARTVALAAAQEGVTAARVLDAVPADGVERAAQYIEDNGADTLMAPTVVATTPAAGIVAIEVSGRSLSVVPGMALTVTQSAQGPVESFTEAGAP
ncbi:MAG TPA: TadE family protein [Pengzhenrongella sp.]